MKFFEKLTEKLTNFDVQMVVTEKNGTISVMIIPKPKNNSIKEDFPAFKITGTATELDAMFFDKIDEPMQYVGGIIDNLDEFKKSLNEKAEKIKEKDEKKKKSGKTKADSKKEEEESESQEEENDTVPAEETKPEKKEKDPAETYTSLILEASKQMDNKNYQGALAVYERAQKYATTNKQKEALKDQIMNTKVKLTAQKELGNEEPETEQKAQEEVHAQPPVIEDTHIDPPKEQDDALPFEL